MYTADNILRVVKTSRFYDPLMVANNRY